MSDLRALKHEHDLELTRCVHRPFYVCQLESGTLSRVVFSPEMSLIKLRESVAVAGTDTAGVGEGAPGYLR